MKSRSRLKFHNDVRKIAIRVYALGLLTYPKLEFLKLAGRRVERRVMVNGRWPIWVHSTTPDLRVAILNLTEEFEFLGQLFPESYIGTAALKFSEMYLDATVVTVELSSEIMSILSRNIAGRENIVVIRAVLAPERGGHVNLFDPGRNEWGYTVVEEEEEGRTHRCLNLWIPSPWKRYPPDSGTE